ncbi:Fe-only nitrogenase accessory protein AnfO [Opitutaceae bacterium TAV4]|nr:Fe-only nitrogenase accessory protein AnfO [Opitutaceae bacterium TAV4]RRK01833.1 Fe-only nitrogenase accessory protein AnfO [Opitutaceae bacterium TAV3]
MTTETSGDDMEIAAYVNGRGAPASFYEEGGVRVYRRIFGQWEDTKEIPFRLTRDMGLAGLHGEIRRMAGQLGGCRIFIVDELRGVPCAILDSMGFSLWKGHGPVREQLEVVAEKLQEDVRAMEAGDAGPVAVGDADDGVWRINLRQVLKSNAALNSRQVLLPFLETTVFRSLEVLCDHCPRWMDEELDRLNLRFEESVWDEGGVKVTITPAPEPALGAAGGRLVERAPRRYRSRCGGGCCGG